MPVDIFCGVEVQTVNHTGGENLVSLKPVAYYLFIYLFVFYVKIKFQTKMNI